jgi:hypothetical protein
MKVLRNKTRETAEIFHTRNGLCATGNMRISIGSFWRSRFVLVLLLLGAVPRIGRAQQIADAYSWIDTDLNAIQFYRRDAIERFFQAWTAADSSRVSILHLGDSHIQPDIFPGVLRKRFQELLGPGGRGLMFPFSTAIRVPGPLRAALSHFPSTPLVFAGLRVEPMIQRPVSAFAFQNPYPPTITLCVFFARSRPSATPSGSARMKVKNSTAQILKATSVRTLKSTTFLHFRTVSASEWRRPVPFRKSLSFTG